MGKASCSKSPAQLEHGLFLQALLLLLLLCCRHGKEPRAPRLHLQHQEGVGAGSPPHHPAAPAWLEGRGQAAGRPPQPCRSVISKDKVGRARQRSSLTKLTSSHPSPRGQGSHPELRCRVRALLPWPSCSQAAFGPHSPPRLPAVLGRSQQCWHVESWRWDLAAGFADEGRAASPKNGSFARFGVG